MSKTFKKIVCILFTIIVVCALFYGAYYTISAYRSTNREDDEYSFFENRNLAKFPVAEPERMLDGSFFSDIETFVIDHMALRDQTLELDTYINMNILCRPVVNETVVCDDVLLPYNEFEVCNEEEINNCAEQITANITSHSEKVESYGGEFIYVAVPCQYVCYQNSYPSYLNNRSEYIDLSTNALFSRFEQNGIDYIDMNEIFIADGMPDGYSSTVDNHYNIEGAYRTYEAIIDRINEITNFNLTKLDSTNSYIETLPNRYLGSRNRKLFGMWEDNSHLGILLANESVAFRRIDYSRETVPTVYTLPENDTDEILYTLYMYGDIGNTILDTQRPELPSILIYGDSFTNPVESIIYNNFDQMHSIDYRHYNDMSVEDYIDKYKPEIVVCIRDYSALLTLEYNGQ